MPEKYEAVVVGAGPAGLAAALELSKSGVQTLVLERGKTPGSKNATGGILYGQASTPYNLEHVVPGFEKEAPLERPIHDYLMHCVHGDKVKTLDITPLHLHDHKWSYAVLRAPFDRWLAQKTHDAARKHGGGVLSGIRVRGPLVEGGRIVGVETDELEPIHADLVIAADGATSEMVRRSGLATWPGPDQCFQGAKVVVKLPDAKAVEDRFGLKDGVGSAHLFAGDLFGGVRGGGFLYTNRDTLSIGTVFHLDSLADSRIEPHRLLDKLLTHPMVQEWIPDGDEVEYSAKLIPDGKKAALDVPFKDTMLVVGDAAGQLQAQGPVIKGMNLGVTAGILAARSYLKAKAAGTPRSAGPLYAEALDASYVRPALKPLRYRVARVLGENGVANAVLEFLVKNPLGRAILKTRWGQARVQGMMSSPFLAGANPDIRFGYVTLPDVVADVAGTLYASKRVFEPRTLDERIAALPYDTDIGRAHIRLTDTSPAASGRAVHTCPVSSSDSSRGCYRLETAKDPKGGSMQVVALDTQPCIECGTCGIMAATEWTNPRGGKGVEYRWG